MSKGPYTKRGRLADVLALIQVLAFDPDTHRSETGIIEKELGPPSSSVEGWIALAREHRELFRVSEEAAHALSLVARHVQPSDSNKKRPPLSADFTQVLIKTAIDLHDRQVDAADRWKQWMPLWSTLLGGVLVLVSSFLTMRLSHPAKASGRFVPTEHAAVLLDTATGTLCYEGPAGENSAALPNCQDLR